MLDAQDEDPAALSTFCSLYWAPLYWFARRKGMSAADAEDLTQSFFERLLSRDLLGSARSERGRLRSFLLKAFGNFAAEEWRKAGAQKRGGGRSIIAMDVLSAEEQLAAEPRDSASPEVEYERAWARTLLRQARDQLGAAYSQAGKGAIFNALEDQLVDGDSALPYREIGATLGLSEASARFAAFRLRQQFRQILHGIVADTVASPDEIEAELAQLRKIFQD